MQPDIKRILYCTDLSENSKYACRYALYLACKTDAEIHVLFVAEKPSPDAMVTLETYMRDFGGREQFLKKRLDQAKEMLSNQMKQYFSSLPDDEKPGADRIKALNVCESDPVDEILKQSERLKCDLIVMGTHHKGVAYTFLGSVSKKVMSNTRIPVMVVPLPKT
jgi:nucleotide-binding universal stress UspA family protein